MAVDDQALAAHHALLAEAVRVEDERRAQAQTAPGTGLLLDSQVRPGQVGLGFGEGWRPAPHVPPAPKPMAGELVGGVLGAGARKVAPGARPPAVSRVVLTTSAAVAHNRGDQVAYVSPGELGTSPGLLARFLAWIRGGKA